MHKGKDYMTVSYIVFFIQIYFVIIEIFRLKYVKI